MAASSAAPRSTLEDFTLVQKIGSGSYGLVWKVLRKVDGGTYALKEVDLFGMSKKEQEECIRETQLLSEFDCEHIIKYWDAFLQRGKLYIVMEYAGGGNLHDLIRRSEGPLPEEQIWRLLIQMLLGLHAMHHRSVLHRDLKTLNVFLDDGLNVKLGDLGVAKILSNNTVLARTIVGTPYYLSPELCEDQPYGAKSDVWALGVSLYECCMRCHPFDADNQGALVLKILRGRYAPVEGYSRELAAVVDACLTLDPDRRPDTTQLLGLPALREHAGALGIPLPPLPDNYIPYVPAPTPGRAAAGAGVGHQPPPGGLVPPASAAVGMLRKPSSKELLPPLQHQAGGAPTPAAAGGSGGNGLIRAAAVQPAAAQVQAVAPRPPSRPRSAASPAAAAPAALGPRGWRPSWDAGEGSAHSSPRGEEGARRSPSPAAMARAWSGGSAGVSTASIASMQIVGRAAPLQPRPPAVRSPSQQKLQAAQSVLLQSQQVDGGLVATAAADAFSIVGSVATQQLQQTGSVGSPGHSPVPPTEGSISPRKLAAALRSPRGRTLPLPPLSPGQATVAAATVAVGSPPLSAGGVAVGNSSGGLPRPGLPVLGVWQPGQQLGTAAPLHQTDRAQQLAVALIEVKAGIAAKVGQRAFEALHELLSTRSFSSDRGSLTSSGSSSTISTSFATATAGGCSYGGPTEGGATVAGAGTGVLGSCGSSTLGSAGLSSGAAAQALAAQPARLLSPARSHDSSGLLLGDALRAAALQVIPEPAVEEVLPLLVRLSMLEGQLGAQQLQ